MEPSSIKVNLHCHSDRSDGRLSPEALAEHLAAAGVRFAALTDHDTVDGLGRFRAALSRHGIGFVSGVEITAQDGDGPIHLLVYGFDAASPHLGKALAKASSAGEGERGLPAVKAIEWAHRAGGKVFLAHPLAYGEHRDPLPTRLTRLKAMGLDGLEAIYAPYTQAQIEELLELAREYGLVVSAGCDFHGPDQYGLSEPGMHMPPALWRTFRDAILPSHAGAAPEEEHPAWVPKLAMPRFEWRHFVLRILAPTLLALGLLILPMFVYVIPAFESALLGRKREMIRELTNSAHSILQEYHQEVLSGRMSRPAAQAAASERLEFLRYGKEDKDYFWITDLHPRMVMHPYRADLNGQDLSNYVDPKGNRVFVEFARLAQEKREGYFEYVWQWKDDPRKLAPKQSYVRLFEPWGWVVGTGIYLDDVHAEIATLTDRVVHVSLVIAAMIAMLLAFVAHQSFRMERRRLRAEESLRESHAKYRALVQASKEGTLMVLEGRCVFANPTFLAMTGYSEEAWGLVDLEEAFHLETGSMTQWIRSALSPSTRLEPLEAQVRCLDGSSLHVLVTPERIQLGDQDGVILIVRDLRAQREVQAALDESQARFRSVAENLKAGVFRALAEGHMRILEANPAAGRLLNLTPGRTFLKDAFGSPSDFETFRDELLITGESRERLFRLPDGRLVSLTATLVRDDSGEPKYCDAIAEDVTVRQQETLERESLIADLQTSLLFLGEPVKRFMREPHGASLQMPLAQAAELMNRHRASALIIQGSGGEAIGLVTDRDLRERVVARHLPLDRPVFEVMTSPLLAISPNAQGHEALALMRDRDVQHLAVKDEQGTVVGIVRGHDLLQVDHYPLVLLSRAIKEALRPEEVAALRRRLPVLVKSLVESGARPRHICRAISAITDTVIERLAAFVEAESGPAPVPFAFLAMGSEGREEQTLFSDQDTAIVFGLPEGIPEAEAAPWLLRLGEKVSLGLESAGFPVCKGGMMARNPRWCQPLDQWKRYFSDWIRLAEPQNLMEFNTFFDLRCVHGDPSLAAEIRLHIHAELASAGPFFTLMAQDALQYKPPLGFFGKIVTDTDARGQKTFNVKDAMASIVNFARLYALRHHVTETSTFDRLRRLHEMGVLASTSHEDLLQAHDFLMSLRLRHQADQLTAGLPADNVIALKSLPTIEENLLKQVFAQIAVIQKRIGFDFLGAG